MQLIKKYSFLFVILVFFQVTVFNNVVLHGLITPFPYIIFILLLPISMGRVSILFLSFLMGLTIDLLIGTGGINAAASVLIAYLRPFILKTLLTESKFEDIDSPSITRLGILPFLLYAFVLALIHHLVLFFIDVYTFQYFFYIFFKSLLSSILTSLLVMLYAFASEK